MFAPVNYNSVKQLTLKYLIFALTCMMKIIFTCFFCVVSLFTFSQLSPKLADFRGQIEKVTEKRYGKEIAQTQKDSGVFKPKAFSGWKYVYLFDRNSKPIRRTDYFKDKIMAIYRFERLKSGNRFTEKQITVRNQEKQNGDYLEYENFLDSLGRINRVNYWAYESKNKSRELFLIEMNPVYKENKLVSFTRHNIKPDGKMDSGETCTLFYNNAGNLIKMERKDIGSELKTVIDYNYNSRGFVTRYAVDYLLGFPEYVKNPKQDILFKYDKHGNWIRKYLISGDKKRLESKRIIKYR